MEQQEYRFTTHDKEGPKKSLEYIDPDIQRSKLQSSAKLIEWKQPKVLIGSSYYNEISNFEKQQWKLAISHEWINKDGTIKYSLQSRNKITRFDYDPHSKVYYMMPAWQPDKKIIFESELQIITAAERINFCKYNNTADPHNNVAPYESNGVEIKKGTNYLISSHDFIFPRYTMEHKEYMDLLVYYLNIRKTTNE